MLKHGTRLSLSGWWILSYFFYKSCSLIFTNLRSYHFRDFDLAGWLMRRSSWRWIPGMRMWGWPDLFIRYGMVGVTIKRSYLSCSSRLSTDTKSLKSKSLGWIKSSKKTSTTAGFSLEKPSRLFHGYFIHNLTLENMMSQLGHLIYLLIRETMNFCCSDVQYTWCTLRYR